MAKRILYPYRLDWESGRWIYKLMIRQLYKTLYQVLIMMQYSYGLDWEQTKWIHNIIIILTDKTLSQWLCFFFKVNILNEGILFTFYFKKKVNITSLKKCKQRRVPCQLELRRSFHKKAQSPKGRLMRLPAGFPMHQAPSKIGPTLKEKNYLLNTKFMPSRACPCW